MIFHIWYTIYDKSFMTYSIINGLYDTSLCEKEARHFITNPPPQGLDLCQTNETNLLFKMGPEQIFVNGNLWAKNFKKKVCGRNPVTNGINDLSYKWNTQIILIKFELWEPYEWPKVNRSLGFTVAFFTPPFF